MGLRSEVQSILLGTVLTGLVRYITHPAAAAGIVVVDDTNSDEIIDNTIETNVHWLCALQIQLDSDPVLSWEQTILEGSGGANGAAVAPATILVSLPYSGRVLVGATANLVNPPIAPIVPYNLPFPIRVAASTRHAASIPDSVTNGTDIRLHIVVARAVGP